MSILKINHSFVWFVGQVTDLADPEKIGRIRVRAIPFYKDVDVDQLPWAQCIQPIQSAAQNGVGLSPTGIQVGSHVIGFFLDGDLAQQPMIVGSFAGIGDISELATGTNIVPRTRAPAEPASSFGAEYPHNKTLTTSSGHVIEIDDTPGKERLHIFHKEGSYVEFRPDGAVIYKTDGNRFDMTVGRYHGFVQDDFRLFVNGQARIQVEGDASILTRGQALISADEKIIFASPEIEINGPVQFNEEGDAEEQEAFDLGDDAPVSTPREYTALVRAAGGTVVSATPQANSPVNNVNPTHVTCGNYSATSPEIVHLSSGVDVVSFRHAIPSAGKNYSGSGFSGHLSAEEIVCNLAGVHENIVKPLFAHFGSDKFNINSGYRTGSGPSQHDAGMAVDIQVKAGTGFGIGDPTKTIEYLEWMQHNLSFDQLALEYSGRYPNQGWIHCSYVRPGTQYRQNRRMIATWDAGPPFSTVVNGSFYNRTLSH